MRSGEAYILSNERRIDGILLKCVAVLILVGPLLMLCKRYAILNVENWECIGLSVFNLAVVVVAGFFYRSQSYRYVVKHLLLLGMHAGVCFVSAKEGINLRIAYMMMPALACLYFRRRFMLQITGICYVMMICALYVRSYGEVAAHYPGWEAMDWFGVNGIAYTLEYVLLACILDALVKTICDSLSRLEKKNEQIYEMQKQLVIGFANVLESRDRDTGSHVKRTADYACMLAQTLLERNMYTDELTEKFISDLTLAAPLHDAGKICVPDKILLKNGQLTDEEYEVIKSHTTEGKRLVEMNLSNLEDKALYDQIISVVYCHHEHWDGSGYPQGLTGAEIPLAARILAVADTLDALVNERCYKSRMDLNEAFRILEEQKGVTFEPCMVEAVVAMRGSIEMYMNGETAAQ